MAPHSSRKSGTGLRIDPGDRPSLVSALPASPWPAIAWPRLRLPKLPKLPRLARSKRGGPKPASGGGAGGSGRGGGGGKRRRGGWVAHLVGLAISLVLLGLIGAGGIVALYSTDLPDLDSLTATTRKPNLVLLSADGETIAAYGDIYGEPVTLAQLPKYLPEAVLATEDRHFYSHFGLDPIGMARALVADLRAGHVVQGGSTVTQQLAKNLFLTPERSLKRKVQEVLLALELERRFTKDQILALYLNRVYLGNGTWGVDAAARRYFGIPATRLDLYQSALIAGLLKAPSRYNPLSDADLSRERTRQVLDNMVAVGDITEADADRAARTGPSGVRKASLSGRFFADWVRDHVEQYVREDRDVVVRTTLDMSLQRRCEAALAAMLDGPGKKAGASQGAIVVMSPDGAVRAMVGGADYSDSQFNRAVQALRQPGSSFKPFLYLAAMEAGWTPSDSILDEPIASGDYHPQNYEGTYEGEITLHRAFAKSSNVAAVRLIEKIGAKTVAAVAKRLGIAEALGDDASLALGTSDTTLLEMTTAYASFANDGDGVFAYGVAGIDDRQGRSIYRREGGGAGRVVQPLMLAEMDELMQAVIAEGTGKRAALDRPAAGKTGTTQDYRDAWFIGFTADYVTGVWLGNDDDAPMKRVTGGTLPAELWHTVMMDANHGLAARALPGASVEAVAQAASAPGAAPAQGANPTGRGGQTLAPAAPGAETGSSFEGFVNSLMKFLGGKG